MNQGSRAGSSDGVHDPQDGSEEPCPEGDRASVRAKKRGNARGAKGGRDMVAVETMSGTTKAVVVPGRADRARGSRASRTNKESPLASERKPGERTLAVG